MIDLQVEEQNDEHMEVRVLAAWRELLGISDVDKDENFFDMGGSSLLAARLAGRLSLELGRPISAAEIFAHPSVRSLSDSLKGEASTIDRQQVSQRAAMQRRALGAPRGRRN